MARDGNGTMVPVTNSWNVPVNGVLATGSDFKALYDDLISALTQSVSRDGQSPMTGNLNMGNNKINGVSAGTGSGQALAFEQLFAQGTMQDLASAATTDIGLQNTNFLRITGNTTITSFGTNYRGPRFLVFAGAVTLTNSSTLVLPGGANITTSAGDVLIAIPGATLGTADKWIVTAYQKNAVPGSVSPQGQTSKIQPVTASVASNALTVTLNLTALDFRSATLGNGTVNTRTIGAALSAVVPSGATLGTTNGVLSRVMILAIDNAGTIELAVCNGSLSLDESTLISTTILDAASDSATVIYSATARTSVPFRIVGYVESTQATAGTWATAPSKIQGIGGQIRQASVSSISQGTAVNSTSGAAIDFTGIPSWVKRITVMFSGVSTNGTSLPQVQIGSGSVTTSGYVATSSILFTSVSVSAATSGFIINSNQAAAVNSGQMVLTNVSGNVWVACGCVGNSSGTVTMSISTGNLTLGGALDRIRITTVNGTDTFDAGSINIFYE